MLDNWQRIEKVVSWTGLSVNAFARSIGLKRAENLYQIKKGNYGISKELAELISVKYPNISKSWLLTGSGEMFLEESQNLTLNIPYYKVDVVKLLSQESFTPSGFLSLPFLSGYELAALYLGKAMEPEIPYSSIVVIRKIELNRILPGKSYLILSDNFNGIRIVRREPGSPLLRLVPRNKEEFDDVIIDVAQVQYMYQIGGYILTR